MPRRRLRRFALTKVDAAVAMVRGLGQGGGDGGLIECGLESEVASPALIEEPSEIHGGGVVDIFGGGDHDRAAGIEQSTGLLPGGAAVEKYQLEAVLQAEESGQIPGIDGAMATRLGLQQEPIAVGMAGIVEHRDAVAVGGLLEDSDDLVRTDIGLDHQLAQSGLLGGGQGATDAVDFLREITQMPGRVDPVVGVDQEDDRGLGLVGFHLGLRCGRQNGYGCRGDLSRVVHAFAGLGAWERGQGDMSGIHRPT